MKSQRSAIVASAAIARGRSRNSAAISAGGFRWRSLLTHNARPASSSVVPSRIQVITSSSARSIMSPARQADVRVP